MILAKLDTGTLGLQTDIPAYNVLAKTIPAVAFSYDYLSVSSFYETVQTHAKAFDGQWIALPRCNDSLIGTLVDFFELSDEVRSIGNRPHHFLIIARTSRLAHRNFIRRSQWRLGLLNCPHNGRFEILV
jgi:hypothetical protein